MVFLFPFYLYVNNIIEKLRKIDVGLDVKWYRTVLKHHELHHLLVDIETIVDKVVIIDKGSNLLAYWLKCFDCIVFFLDDVGGT